MKTYKSIQLRAFNVSIKDQRTGETREDVIVLSKDQLQAAQVVGTSSNELIIRFYNRQGFYVLDIGKVHKVEATLDLEELFSKAVM